MVALHVPVTFPTTGVSPHMLVLLEEAAGPWRSRCAVAYGQRWVLLRPSTRAGVPVVELLDPAGVVLAVRPRPATLPPIDDAAAWVRWQTRHLHFFARGLGCDGCHGVSACWCERIARDQADTAELNVWMKARGIYDRRAS